MLTKDSIFRKGTLSEKQVDALWHGMLLRHILCLDSLAHRFMSDSNRQKIRAIVNDELRSLGYETFEEHHERISKIWVDPNYDKISDKELDKAFKWQRRA